MPAQPRLLEVFACEGGAAAGYARAGWDVTCVDTDPKVLARNPFRKVRADAIEYIAEHGHKFHAITGGPPCQYYTKAQRIRNNDHPDLIAATREVMVASGKLYVIENVEEARPWLKHPTVLCGAMFGLRTYRHRLFESNVDLQPPATPFNPVGKPQSCGLVHLASTVKMGRPIGPTDFYHAVGNFSGVEHVRRDMDVPWMDRDGIRECIPPSYSRHIGTQLLRELS